MKREKFIKTGLLGLAGMCSVPIISSPLIQDGTEPIKIGTIREFVSAGHNNLEKVKEMLSEIPNLIYSRYDWGKGGFEEAVEGAGHVGNKEIANYLIEKGARVNLFVLTMLGKTNMVKPVLETYPGLIYAKGAHGFTLLHHAKAGGEECRELYAYLTEKGLRENKFNMK